MFLRPANVPRICELNSWLRLSRFDPSAAAITAHAAPLRSTCFKFTLLAVIMFPGLETASKGFQTTQLSKPIRIRQNTPMLPIQILLVSLILFELL